MQHAALQTFESGVKKALDHLHAEFAKLQTGRAHSSLVEHVQIESYGQRMDLRAVASIAVQDAQTITIQPWDKSLLGEIEKALRQVNIGGNPVNDGALIRITLPPMTEERRLQFTKIVGQLEEEAKIKVRQLRHDAQDELKKEADEDDRERLLKDLQKAVDDANAKITESGEKKAKDIMTV